jgi:mRNA-degrading endonuclease toxin of MazEF toxin-antitoxin module
MAVAGETEVVIQEDTNQDRTTTTTMTMVTPDQIQLNQPTEVEVHNSLEELQLPSQLQVDPNKTLFTSAT